MDWSEFVFHPLPGAVNPGSSQCACSPHAGGKEEKPEGIIRHLEECTGGIERAEGTSRGEEAATTSVSI